MALSGTPLTETSAFTANVYPPQANSAIASNDVAAGEQALANRTLFLNDTKFDKAGGTVTGALTVSGASIFNGSVETNGTLQVDGAATVTAKIILSGNGAGIRRRWGDVNDADTMLHTTADVYLCAVASATRDLTLSVTTAPVPQDGEQIDLVVEGALAGQYDVYYEGSAQPLVTALGNGTIDSMASFVYRASTARWYLLHTVNGTVGTNAA